MHIFPGWSNQHKHPIFLLGQILCPTEFINVVLGLQGPSERTGQCSGAFAGTERGLGIADGCRTAIMVVVEKVLSNLDLLSNLAAE